MTDTPQTLLEAVRYYSDLKICFETMIAVKWPDGKITCPKCGGDAIGVIRSRSMLQCKAKGCRKQFSAKVGTIFEDSPLGLDKWFVAVWCIANAKNGISSLELGRALGVTQKTAWFMLHRIREAMKTRTARKMRGQVEGDETFIGGRAKNMHKDRREKLIRGRGAVGKAIVQGLLERPQGERGVSQFRGFVVGNTEEYTLCPNVWANVENGATVYTDATSSYGSLGIRYFHKWVDHLTHYARGLVHVNGLENFWSLFKRCIRGTYVAVAAFHLERYLDEQAFRFNERDTNDAGRFAAVLMAVVGKRLTYRVLTAKDDAGFMGIR
jgi:transposase-like protein